MNGEKIKPRLIEAYKIADEIDEMIKKEEAKEKREKLISETSAKTEELLSA